MIISPDLTMSTFCSSSMGESCVASCVLIIFSSMGVRLLVLFLGFLCLTIVVGGSCCCRWVLWLGIVLGW